MSNKEARVLAIGQDIVIGEATYTFSPITIGQLQELNKAALDFYKRQVLETIAQNLDILGPMGPQMLREQAEKLTRMDVDSIPKKKAYEVGHIPVTTKLREYMKDHLGISIAMDCPDFQIMAVMSGLVDSESPEMTPEKVEELTGFKPKMIMVPYDTWWVNATVGGMVEMIHKSLHKKHPKVTRQEIWDWPIEDLQLAARSIEAMTRPEVGNT